MRFESLAMVVRPRSAGEACDLGTRLVQVYRRPLTRAMLLVLLPLAVVAECADLLVHDQAWLWWLLVWWCKPLYDRAILHVLARAAFGEATGSAALVRALPSLLRGGGLAALTWQRLSLARSFVLPVRQLEGLRGAAAKQRTQLLLRGQHSAVYGLLSACSLIENTLLVAMAFGLLQLLPTELRSSAIDGLSLLDRQGLPQQALRLCYLAALVLAEPVYVAAGFALYLARRTDLEAWDVELAFRRLAQRLEQVPAVST